MNGLKALTFLQFWEIPFGKQPMSIMGYYHLLSQPFTPDLITKYFEGWTREVWNSQEIIFIDEREYLIEFGENERNNHDVEYSYYVGEEEKLVTIKPETLNDFIRDCQRAGIELIFKVQNA